MEFKWTPECEAAFEELKFRLGTAPILTLYDPTLETEVRCDASARGLGSVLVQKHPDGWKPVAFASRKLKDAELRYSNTDRELAACMYAVAKFEPYLIGIKFTIVTDHSALTFLQSKKQLSAKLTRFAAQLQAFDFRIVYKSGRLNRDADALSRLPVNADESNAHAEEIEGEVEHLKENREFVFMVQPSKPASPQPPLREARSSLCTTPMTTNELFQLNLRQQMTDPLIRRIKEDLAVYGILPFKRRKQLRPFYLRHGLVMRENELQPSPGCILVPKIMQQAAIEHYHAAGVSAHPGISKTYEKLAAKYYWPTMRRDVIKYVNCCHICSEIKNPPWPVKYPLRVISCERPGQRWAIDVMGFYKKPDGTKLWIVVAVDYFTRWAEAKIIEKNDSAAMTDFLINHIFTRFSCPEELITDQGTPLISFDFQSICATLGINKLQTSVQRPSSNGEIERLNLTIKTMLHASTYQNNRWWENLQVICMAYNTTPHNATHLSPFYLTFLRKPNLPIDMVLESGCAEVYEIYSDYCATMEQRWKQAKKMALLNNQIAKSTYKKYYDRHLNAVPFKVGVKVLRQAPYQPAVQGNKFNPKWIGPFTITKFVSAYVVMLEPVRQTAAPAGSRRTSSKPIITHLAKLKHYLAAQPAAVNDEPTRTAVLTTIPCYSDDEEPVLAVRKKKTAAKRTPAKRKPVAKKRPVRANNQCLQKIIQELLKNQRKTPVKRTMVSERAAGERKSSEIKDLKKRVEKLEEQQEILQKQVRDFQNNRNAGPSGNSNITGAETLLNPGRKPYLLLATRSKCSTNPTTTCTSSSIHCTSASNKQL